MPTGLGDEKLWLCPTLDNATPFNDLSDQANNGTAFGGLATIADTSAGGAFAFDFDGTNDYINCGNAIAPTTGYSASAWVNVTAFPTSGSNSTIVDKGATATTHPFEFGFKDPTLLRSYTYDGTLHGITNYTHGLSTGTWYHIATTFDGSDWRLFVDGIEVATVSDSTALVQNSLNTYVGASFLTSSVDRFLNAKLDDVRIFDRPLNQAEIAHLAEARGITGSPPQGLGDEKLWLCPSINNSPNDISGNGNNGVYQGSMGTVADTGSGGSLAYDFDGTGDYISTAFTPDTSSHDFVSYSAWINIANQSSQVFPILTDRNNITTSGWVNFAISVDSSALKHRAFVPNSWYDLPLTQSSGSWVHLVQVRDKASKQLTVYANGVLVGTSTHTASDTHAGSTFSLGKWDDGASGGGAALLDDVRYYERALTQAEIAHLATSRGIEGSPSTPTAQYNAFATHAFKQLFQTRLR